MGKKSNSKVSLLYLLGTLATVIGFCLPITNGIAQGVAKLLGKTINGFSYIHFDNFGYSSFGALLIFLGSACGLAVSVVKLIKMRVSGSSFLMLFFLVMSICGGVILFFIAKDGAFVKIFGGKNAIKAFFDVAAIGFYLIVGGWISAIVGYVTKI